eukprot:SAG31_NODE_3010_length_4788_cov_4.266098_4_plen_107_part_00
MQQKSVTTEVQTQSVTSAVQHKSVTSAVQKNKSVTSAVHQKSVTSEVQTTSATDSQTPLPDDPGYWRRAVFGPFEAKDGAADRAGLSVAQLKELATVTNEGPGWKP